MILEKSYKEFIANNENYLNEIKIKNDKLARKDEEIKFLNERIYGKKPEMELFETELKIIREKLVDKTQEMFQLQKQFTTDIVIERNKLNEQTNRNNLLVDEINQYKSYIENIVECYKNSNFKELESQINIISNLPNSNIINIHNNFNNETINIEDKKDAYDSNPDQENTQDVL